MKNKEKIKEILRAVPIAGKSYEEYIEALADKLIAEDVIVTPCKMGQTVYMPWEWNGQKGIACLKVTAMSNIIGFDWRCGTDFNTDDEGYADKYNCGNFKFGDFGKTVFLTREEAEKALERSDE